jgi:hypothetical protein
MNGKGFSEEKKDERPEEEKPKPNLREWELGGPS